MTILLSLVAAAALGVLGVLGVLGWAFCKAAQRADRIMQDQWEREHGKDRDT